MSRRRSRLLCVACLQRTRAWGYTKCSACLGYSDRAKRAHVTKRLSRAQKNTIRVLRALSSGKRATAVPMQTAGTCACGLDWMMSFNRKNFVMLNHKKRAAVAVYGRQ